MPRLSSLIHLLLLGALVGLPTVASAFKWPCQPWPECNDPGAPIVQLLETGRSAASVATTGFVDIHHYRGCDQTTAQGGVALALGNQLCGCKPPDFACPSTEHDPPASTCFPETCAFSSGLSIESCCVDQQQRTVTLQLTLTYIAAGYPGLATRVFMTTFDPLGVPHVIDDFFVGRNSYDLDPLTATLELTLPLIEGTSDVSLTLLSRSEPPWWTHEEDYEAFIPIGSIGPGETENPWFEVELDEQDDFERVLLHQEVPPAHWPITQVVSECSCS